MSERARTEKPSFRLGYAGGSINAGSDIYYSSTDMAFLSSGTLTPTPEPGTALLWLTGIGFMILMRKHLARLLQFETLGALRT